jgi:hypothetical protein
MRPVREYRSWLGKSLPSFTKKEKHIRDPRRANANNTQATVIENFDKELDQELLRKKVDTLMEFEVELQQRDNIPRLAYLMNLMQSLGTLITSFVPGFKCAQVHWCVST